MLVGQKETCKVTDFGMARDVQQENIYERKTKVIKKKGRWGRYHISFSLVIFDIIVVVELIYSWFQSWIPWDPNETISHAYTSTILNITISDYSLPIILELFHKVIFKIFRAVFPWSGQLMRPCCMVNIPPKVTCKYTWLLPLAIFSTRFINFNQDMNFTLCQRIHML